jgi:hypothetical protein
MIMNNICCQSVFGIFALLDLLNHVVLLLFHIAVVVSFVSDRIRE